MDTKKVRKRQIGSFKNVYMAQYGEYRLEGSQDKRICVIRPGKREKTLINIVLKGRRDGLETS